MKKLTLLLTLNALLFAGALQAQVAINQDGSDADANSVLDVKNSANNSVLYIDDNTGNTGIGIASPSQKLDVNGVARIRNYLLIGNPTEHTNAGSPYNDVVFYHVDFGAMNYWNYILSICDNPVGGLWYYGTDYMVFDNEGSTRHYRALYSPYIWLPSNINSAEIKVELDHECTLEDNYDGVYLEYSQDMDATYSSVSSWSTNGYSSSVVGSDQSCAVANVPAWTAGSFAGRVTSTSNIINHVYFQGTWIRFRLVGMEDISNSTGNYKIYDFKLLGDNVVYGSAGSDGFSNGDIYAEGHVYAQSSMQLGDVAEYFPIKEFSEPGDLISMNSGNSNLCYLTDNKNADLIIGVHSSSPSIVVNNPKNGIPIALAGRVSIKVNDENGPIKPGDYLTASSVAGVASKAVKPSFIVGRAMETLENGSGKIICMINPGWYNPNPISEGVISGSAKILRGKKSFNVIDQRINEHSRVFVSLRGNPGSYYWISNVHNGGFEISFDKEIINDVEFDYLVNNASSKEEIENTINTKIVSGIKNVKKEENTECTNCDSKRIYIDIDGRELDGIAVSDNPPSDPPDANKVWTWDPVNGFVEVDSDINRLLKQN